MNRLIYIADPMCSWCHGFSPTLTKLVTHYEQQLGFSMVMGGLRPGGHTPWDQKMRDFLRHHWEEVARKTGQPFSYDLLEQEHFKYDTEPACRAVCVVKAMVSEKAFLFFKAIQHAFYFLNNDPNDLAFYLPICEDLGIDAADFSAKFQSDEYKDLTKRDFAYSHQLGVRGFPTLVLINDGKVQVVVRGYAEFDGIKERIDELLRN